MLKYANLLFTTKLFNSQATNGRDDILLQSLPHTAFLYSYLHFYWKILLKLIGKKNTFPLRKICKEYSRIYYWHLYIFTGNKTRRQITLAHKFHAHEDDSTVCKRCLHSNLIYDATPGERHALENYRTIKCNFTHLKRCFCWARA